MIAVWLQFGALAVPAAAQMRVLVVPGDSAVVVPPRGAAQPAGRPRPARRPRITRQEIQADRGSGSFLGDGTGLAVPFLAILPLAAAAALASTLPGSGGGTSSPARTR